MIQILQISQVSFSSIQMMAIHRKEIAKYDLLRNSSFFSIYQSYEKDFDRSNITVDSLERKLFVKD